MRTASLGKDSLVSKSLCTMEHGSDLGYIGLCHWCWWDRDFHPGAPTLGQGPPALLSSSEMCCEARLLRRPVLAAVLGESLCWKVEEAKGIFTHSVGLWQFLVLLFPTSAVEADVKNEFCRDGVVASSRNLSHSCRWLQTWTVSEVWAGRKGEVAISYVVQEGSRTKTFWP